MVATETCRFNKYGHCKFNMTCRNRHVEIICEIEGCNGLACDMRHPIRCRYFTLFGHCKFNPCSYRHEVIENHMIKNVKARVDAEEKKLLNLECIVEEKAKAIEDLEAKFKDMERKTQFITGEIMRLDQIIMKSKPATTVHSAVLDTLSSTLPSQLKTSTAAVPLHKQLDRHGYPLCWQHDFVPICCRHKHDPGRGGRNVPPDLSKCCNHQCTG